MENRVSHPMLAYDTLIANGANPSQTLLFLHGILGRGSNWRSIARRFVNRRPDFAATLVDLRAHGGSKHIVGPHSVVAAAADLETLDHGLKVGGVLGHSFGGKVALAFSDANETPVFLIDSPPGARPDRRGSEDVLQILSHLRTLVGPFETRRAFVHAMMECGVTRPISSWLAMNLEEGPEGPEGRTGSYLFSLNLDDIDALLSDYFKRDYWHVLERGPVTVIAGADSTVFSAEDCLRARSAAGGSCVRIKGAGHWVHVDAPNTLLDMLVEHA